MWKPLFYQWNSSTFSRAPSRCVADQPEGRPVHLGFLLFQQLGEALVDRLVFLRRVRDSLAAIDVEHGAALFELELGALPRLNGDGSRSRRTPRAS